MTKNSLGASEEEDEPLGMSEEEEESPSTSPRSRSMKSPLGAREEEQCDDG
jgi:hypothetical protein